LLPVLLVTYPLNTAIVGLAYTLYVEYLHQLRVSTQLTEEMRVARSIQQGLFPRTCPQVDGYRLAARCLPARETGGDFFDFIKLGDGRLGVVIGDAAGKGMPAALLMADARSIWRAEARLGYGPAETLRRANRSLFRDINSDGFVTCLYAVLDPAVGEIRFSGAGHPLPLLHNGSGVMEIEAYGLPLGLQQDVSYDEVSTFLAPGDMVVLYTDGVVESLNSSRELFGFERMMRLVQREGSLSAEAMVERTWSAAHAFSGEAGQADDITVIALKTIDDAGTLVGERADSLDN
jgi:sigma-B regulation protein RsbU (phosphoserine phosphatase)